MDRLFIVNGQPITNDDLETIYGHVEDVDHLHMLKLHGRGILEGLDVTENTPTANMNVKVATGYGWEGYGKTVWVSSIQTVDCSVDRDSNSTIPSAGNERYISLVAKQTRALSGLQVDPLAPGGQLYTLDDDSFTIEVVSGAEAAIGNAVAPTIAADELHLCDIYAVVNTTTAITQDMILTDRVLYLNDPASALAQHIRERHRVYDDTGAEDALVITPTDATAYTEHDFYWVNPANLNTGACTINVNSLGAKSIKLLDGSDPHAGAISPDKLAHLWYDGTNFILIDWLSTDSSAYYFGDGSDGSQTYASNTELGDAVDDSDFQVMNYVNLTIDAGVTITTQARKKALVIYCLGDCTINGTLHMNSKGAAGVPSDGISTGRMLASVAPFDQERTPITFTIPREGAAADTAGENGQTGGGGKGGSAYNGTEGDGARGTAWCGGPGGGGAAAGRHVTYGYDPSIPATDGVEGGKGGDGGNCEYDDSGTHGGGGGGAGNAGGTGYDGGSTPSDQGGGGTIILIVKGNLTIGASAVISADGGDGGSGGRYTDNSGVNNGGGGGGSGGGSILVLYGGTLSNSGTIRANGGSGGAAGTAYSGGESDKGNAASAGNPGGAGSIQGPTKIAISG